MRVRKSRVEPPLVLQDPMLAIKRAFFITTGKPETQITDDDELPADRQGFFSRISVHQRVLMIDLYDAKTVGGLARILKLKRDYPHVVPVEGESEVVL